MANRLKKEKEYAQHFNLPLPTLLPDEMAKLNSIISPNSDFFQHYTPGKLIGQGTICDGVFNCESNMTGEKFAVKILSKNILKPFDKLRYLKEVQLLRQIDHPNIIRFENYF